MIAVALFERGARVVVGEAFGFGFGEGEHAAGVGAGFVGVEGAGVGPTLTPALSLRERGIDCGLNFFKSPLTPALSLEGRGSKPYRGGGFSGGDVPAQVGA